MDYSHNHNLERSTTNSINPGPFKDMVAEADTTMQREDTNITTEHHQFALQVDGDVPATLSYRFVPLKVENVGDPLGDDIPLDPILQNDALRLTLVPPAENQVYVVNHLNNQDPAQRASRSTPAAIAHRIVTAREEKRRVTHNLVERRRRDKINTWICNLAKVLPDGVDIQPKSSQSKGGILSKACDYIEELRHLNEQYADRVRYIKEEMSSEIRFQELEVLQKENASLRNENALLKEKLKQHGLMPS